VGLCVVADIPYRTDLIAKLCPCLIRTLGFEMRESKIELAKAVTALRLASEAEMGSTTRMQKFTNHNKVPS